MRRKDREITDKDELCKIIGNADVCHIAFAVDNEPYIVTLNFGYIWEDRLIIYFHCARHGRKLDMMQANSRVCFEIDIDHELIKGSLACEWSMTFKSIVGYGVLSEVLIDSEKELGLDLIMKQYGANEPNVYNPSIFGVTEILKLEVDQISGKMKKI